MRRLKVSKLAAAVSLFASRSVGSALFALRGRRGMLINVKIVCSPSLSLSRCLNLSFLLLSLPCYLWGQMKVVPFCYLQCQHRYPHERSPATEQNRRDALNISVNSKQMHPHTRVCVYIYVYICPVFQLFLTFRLPRLFKADNPPQTFQIEQSQGLLQHF